MKKLLFSLLFILLVTGNIYAKRAIRVDSLKFYNTTKAVIATENEVELHIEQDTYIDSSLTVTGSISIDSLFNASDTTIQMNDSTYFFSIDSAHFGQKVTTDQVFTLYLNFLDVNYAPNGVTYIASEGAVHPSTANEAMYAPVLLPFNLIGSTVVLDQITVYYTSDASGDDFDLELFANEGDGTPLSRLDYDNIGEGSTGAQSQTCLGADLTLTDYALHIVLDVDDTDTNTDVKIYYIKFEFHLE